MTRMYSERTSSSRASGGTKDVTLSLTSSSRRRASCGVREIGARRGDAAHGAATATTTLRLPCEPLLVLSLVALALYSLYHISVLTRPAPPRLDAVKYDDALDDACDPLLHAEPGREPSRLLTNGPISYDQLSDDVSEQLVSAASSSSSSAAPIMRGAAAPQPALQSLPPLLFRYPQKGAVYRLLALCFLTASRVCYRAPLETASRAVSERSDIRLSELEMFCNAPEAYRLIDASWLSSRTSCSKRLWTSWETASSAQALSEVKFCKQPQATHRIDGSSIYAQENTGRADGSNTLLVWAEWASTASSIGCPEP